MKVIKHAESKLVVQSRISVVWRSQTRARARVLLRLTRISEGRDYYSICNICCSQTEIIMHFCTHKTKRIGRTQNQWFCTQQIPNHSLCVFGFSMLCDSTIVNTYKFRIHYIVNILHLFWSLFDQLYNVYWIHDFVLPTITIAWFQELHRVDHSYVVLFSRKTSCELICVSMYNNIMCIDIYYFTIYTCTCSYFVYTVGCYHAYIYITVKTELSFWLSFCHVCCRWVYS